MVKAIKSTNLLAALASELLLKEGGTRKSIL